jgi:hypothetical protein
LPQNSFFNVSSFEANFTWQTKIKQACLEVMAAFSLINATEIARYCLFAAD